MRMRQSLSQFEAAFREETVEDRARRERLRAEAARRSYVRRQQRVVRHSTARFVMLVLAIIASWSGTRSDAAQRSSRGFDGRSYDL